MRLHICVVGKMRPGPELTLCQDYLSRFDRIGRSYGLGPITVHEVDDRKSGTKAAEAVLLMRAIPQGAHVVALDERGQTPTSPAFADKIAHWRDTGKGDLAFLIGGANGLAADLRARADFTLSFGKMVWPHMLARVMLSEQLYRAASIIAGTPYHRI